MDTSLSNNIFYNWLCFISVKIYLRSDLCFKMLKDDYIVHVSLFKVPVGDTHIEDINAFFRFLAEARKFNNEIMVYPQQVCYWDRKAWKKLLK